MDVVAEKKSVRMPIETSSDTLREMLMREWVLYSLIDKLYRGMTSARTAQADHRDRAHAAVIDLRTAHADLKAVRKDLDVARNDLALHHAWLTDLLSIVEAMIGSVEWKIVKQLMRGVRAIGVSKARDGQKLVKQAHAIRKAFGSWGRRRLPPRGEEANERTPSWAQAVRREAGKK